jgi:threonyl-tRNA synthetase
MPDVHAFCKDLDQAKDEFLKRFELSQEVLKGIGFNDDDFELGIRLTEDFYMDNKEFIIDIVNKHGKPVLLEMWKQRFFYFIVKWEMNFVDNLEKASALATDQIDVENSERYGIKYMDVDGSIKPPYILHCSPSGAIERVIYGLLEKAAFDIKKGIKPSLPLWLAPTQVRIIPVSQEYMEYAEKILSEMSRIRVDIDNRDETVSKKVRDAEKEWIPYVIVIGKRELGAETVPVRVRGEKKQKQISISNLVDQIKEKTADKPFRPVPLPIYLQERPKFIG